MLPFRTYFGLPVNRTTSDPSGRIVYTSLRSSISDENTIRVPSGDHTAVRSIAGVFVKRRTSRPR